MHHRINICTHSGEPFFVDELGGGWTVRELESIWCPVCHQLSSEETTGGSFYTRALTDEEKIEYRDQIEHLQELRKKRDATKRDIIPITNGTIYKYPVTDGRSYPPRGEVRPVPGDICWKQ